MNKGATCSECHSEAFSINKNSGVGKTLKCEVCSTIFKVEIIEPPKTVWFLLFVIGVIAFTTFGRFSGADFMFMVICMSVFLCILSIAFLSVAHKKKVILVKVVKT
jgi:hypothetical protein